MSKNFVSGVISAGSITTSLWLCGFTASSGFMVHRYWYIHIHATISSASSASYVWGVAHICELVALLNSELSCPRNTWGVQRISCRIIFTCTRRWWFWSWAEKSIINMQPLSLHNRYDTCRMLKRCKMETLSKTAIGAPSPSFWDIRARSHWEESLWLDISAHRPILHTNRQSLISWAEVC